MLCERSRSQFQSEKPIQLVTPLAGRFVPEWAPMRRLDWWLGVVLVVLATLLHALIPRYELLVPAPPQNRSVDPPYGDFYAAERFPTLIRLDRWTGAVDSGSLVAQIGDAPKWVWVRVGK